LGAFKLSEFQKRLTLPIVIIYDQSKMERRMNTKLRFFAVLFAVTLALAWNIPSVGQVLKGSISGTVVDPQGAVVSGATVKATNVETGVVNTTTSDSSGLFRLNLIPTGSYTIEVGATGFKTASQKGVVVTAGSDSGVGAIHMTIGETSTTVEVSAAAPLVETTQSQVTNTFTSATLQSFAGVQENEGLDNLALFVPGVSGSRMNNFSDSNGGGGFTVQGMRGRNNDQQIDGQNNNDNSVGGPGLFISDPEFVQQYVLVTNQFGPEYGRNAGSVVNIITKSGGNAWHGNIFGTEGNSYLNALTNTQKRFGIKPGSVSPTNPAGIPLSGPPRSNEEFTGGTIGGPILRNKAFVFGGFDDDLTSQQTIFSTSALTPTPAGLAQLAACFPTGAGAQALAALTSTGPYGITAGNPTTLFGKTGAPTAVAVAGCSSTVPMAGVLRGVQAPIHQYDFVVKNDITLGGDSITGRYLNQRANTFNGSSSGTAASAAGYPNDVTALSQVGLISWTHSFSSHMINETRVSYGRLNVGFGGGSLGTVPTAPNLLDARSNINFNSSTLLGWGPATNIPQSRLVNTWQGQDNWSYVLGKHNFKAGANWTYQRSPNIFLGTVNGQFRFTDWSAYFADTPNRVQIAEGKSLLDFREYDTFVYGGDDWKIGQNLTLNLGLTWSYYGQPANLFHDITTPRESNPATALWNPALPLATRTFPVFPSPKNSFGPSAGFVYSPQWGGFITGHGKTTIRGGYRMLYDPPFYNIYINMSSSAPEVFLQTFNGTCSPTPCNPILPSAQFGLPASPTGANARALLGGLLTPGVFDPNTFSQTSMSPNFGPDKVHSWSFGFERELTKEAALEVRYAGNHGLNLFQSVDGNPYVANLKADYPSLVPASITPCAVTGQVGPGAGSDIGRVNCGPGVLRIRNNGGYSDYHGVQMEFRANNLFKQLTVRTGYTFSKTTDNVSEIFGTGNAGNTSAFAQNPLDTTTGEHALSGIDFPNRWTIIAVEELPFFREQHGLVGHILGGWRISADYIAGSGQNFTPLQIGEARLSTGRNYYDTNFLNTFSVSSESARPFAGSPNAPLTSVGIFAGDACTVFVPTAQKVGSQVCAAANANTLVSMNALNIAPNFLSPASYVPVTKDQVRYIINTKIAQQLFGTPFGNTPRNSARDAISNVGNLTVYKRLKFTERMNFEVHATALNVFNHYNFSSVDPALADAGLVGNTQGFGDPSTTSTLLSGNGFRRVFIGGKFTF
jgi:Carboxypeptidase regulatory-like domain